MRRSPGRKSFALADGRTKSADAARRLRRSMLTAPLIRRSAARRSSVTPLIFQLSRAVLMVCATRVLAPRLGQRLGMSLDRARLKALDRLSAGTLGEPTSHAKHL